MLFGDGADGLSGKSIINAQTMIIERCVFKMKTTSIS